MVTRAHQGWAIAYGDVDERDIRDVCPADVARYTQCHFFAGIGFWRDADWISCTDGKWRPVEPGSFPLAHGSPVRVGRLRGYGNAIVAEQAAAFIEAATSRD